ncbi:MAG TPA: 23S rRNA (adenine(2030)-N(6))-methyltransferase RlmJ [Opitutaceae bacterium]|nr:23S rRNA (adenine(2030)-N(6))-methyltransferase RlmJ [Opitutaceae bacterium]
MNYRHHYHAGNYADVFKHVLLLLLVRGLQRKEKGFLYLDTHAGRGGYDLSVAPVLPDGRQRAPEWPAGIGRLWGRPGLGPVLEDFLGLLRRYEERKGVAGGSPAAPSHYPGSPWIVRLLARPQDRLALCELREDDAEALSHEFRDAERVVVRVMDGYTALKAMLPPPERRALVLIDPPFESKGEFGAVLGGLREALRRFPGGTYAVWYPVTERARADEFHREVTELAVPALVAELAVAGEGSAVRMKGCGVLVLNPPWRIEGEIRPVLPVLADALRADAGASARAWWLVPER